MPHGSHADSSFRAEMSIKISLIDKPTSFPLIITYNKILSNVNTAE